MLALCPPTDNTCRLYRYVPNSNPFLVLSHHVEELWLARITSQAKDARGPSKCDPYTAEMSTT